MAKEADAKATVVKVKQGELDGITVSDRKIQELEDLGDALSDLEDEAAAAKERVKEANENLVAAMKKRERTFYSRKTWGSILLKETTTSAKVKKASASSDSGDSE